MRRETFLTAALSLGMAGAMAVPAFAQEAGGNPPPAPAMGQGGFGGGGFGGGGPGGWGGPRLIPEQMRERMQAHLKEQLGVNDEEWKALKPLVDKVQTAQMQAMVGRGGMFGRNRPNPGGDNANRPSSPVANVQHELQTLLENKDATPEQVKAKLTALREAKAKAKEDLAAAQNELKAVLTQRQEAVLVGMGMLD
jgi:hypothetical protein